ncbi:hypothetical protein SAMD00019534_045200 [Acytostelium subglobosum LB1]|uniref:hypothetical protein n=1 Tax=Acytostelium subglobosum LB1 TaxID=1410327 RepID=UPI0006452347|nr:hypothetical protein SAMD00019534_045200 [Acytostelium subglobosum LB1]GAM21345.1 hypothetical protein SAMD00019534_045200 [Acytostelium subglobosum LB1]|eukprot:XP_012755464.1 hypothetical protein SAMD00019534_045200 [Acytostelium subglobosum LB1]
MSSSSSSSSSRKSDEAALTSSSSTTTFSTTTSTTTTNVKPTTNLSFWSRSTPVPTQKWQFKKSSSASSTTPLLSTSPISSTTKKDYTSTTSSLFQRLQSLQRPKDNVNNNNTNGTVTTSSKSQVQPPAAVTISQSPPPPPRVQPQPQAKEKEKVKEKEQEQEEQLTQPDSYGIEPKRSLELMDDLGYPDTDEEDDAASRPKPPTRKAKSDVTASVVLGKQTKTQQRSKSTTKSRSSSSSSLASSSSSSLSSSTGITSRTTPKRSSSKDSLDSSRSDSSYEIKKRPKRASSSSSAKKPKKKNSSDEDNSEQDDNDEEDQYESLAARALKSNKKMRNDNGVSISLNHVSPTQSSSLVQPEHQQLSEDCSTVIHTLQSSADAQTIHDSLSQLCRMLCTNATQISLVLRSTNLFPILSSSMLRLCNQSALVAGATTTTTTATTSPSFSSPSHSLSKRHSIEGGEDLMNQFLSVSSSSSQPITSVSADIDLTKSPVSKGKNKKGKRSSVECLITAATTTSPTTTSPTKIDSLDYRGIILATCFIYYTLSSQAANTDHFTPDVLALLLKHATIIPENYELEYFTTPTKLPRSPKTPGGRRRSALVSSISNLFQTSGATDTVRMSATPSSLSINSLAQLVSHKQFSSTLKDRFREHGLLDGLIGLLAKFTLYLNPLVETSSISPKLIGSVEKVCKIVEECVSENTSNRQHVGLVISSVEVFITLISYLQTVMSKYKERLSGIDIRVGGTEAIISLLNILLNCSHANKTTSAMIGALSRPFKYVSASATQAEAEAEAEDKGEVVVNKFCEYIDGVLANNIVKPLTPKKQAFMDTINSTHFGIQTILNLLRIEVPEKYDIAQLAVTLLVNLVEQNPENRERFRSNVGAIQSILSVYQWRTSERVLTRFTSKIQERVASSYLVILIGFLIKDNETNRELVSNILPNDQPLLPMVTLLMDFIEFQGSSVVSIDNKAMQEKYNKFKSTFELKYGYGAHDHDDEV